MTPDDVVTRARELDGREVLLTVRGVVRVSAFTGGIGVGSPDDGWHTVASIGEGLPSADLVDIQPAPMRIEANTLYVDEDGQAWRSYGIADDGEWRLWPLPTGSMRHVAKINGLRLAKVVPA